MTNQKVRVYQTQSRLIGLHAWCSITVAQITGRVSPRFSYKPKPASRRVRQDQPAFKGEHARLNVCELCEFRAMKELEFVATYSCLSNARFTMQSSEDRALTLGQLEIMEFVRVERVNAKLDKEARKADKDFHRYEMARRQNSPLAPSLAKRAKEIEDAFGPDDRFPPARSTKTKTFRAKGGTRLGLNTPANQPAQKLGVITSSLERAGYDGTKPGWPKREPAASEGAAPKSRLAQRMSSKPGTLSAVAFEKQVLEPIRQRRANDVGNGNLIPERASVAWLKAELKKLLDAERTGNPLSVAEYQFKGALRRALLQRNVEVAHQ